jgi:hypothetical protein
LNSKQKIKSVSELDETQLEQIDFTAILENSFDLIKKGDNPRKITGTNFTVDFFVHNEPVSKTMLGL